jgi:hypothetical protein
MSLQQSFPSKYKPNPAIQRTPNAFGDAMTTLTSACHAVALAKAGPLTSDL